MTAPNKNGKNTVERGPSGRFAKGNRASPGRPAGRGKVAELRDKLAKDLDQIIDVLRAQALAGDPQAIRILLDRVLPSLRPVELPTPLDMPKGNLAQQAHAVVQATAIGDIAPGQAAQIIAALGGVAKIVESTELVARIEALESKLARLERRVKVLEVTERPAVPPRISVMFVSPLRGTVSARLWGGGVLERQEDESEAQFLSRVRRMESNHDQT